jgi:arylsulfatase A-like enzyme
MESEDTYLRLDRDIAEFINYLDDTYGHDGYLMFLTADHGGAHNARFLMDNKVPAGVEPENAKVELNSYIKKVFGIDTLVVFTENYQICLNEAKLTPANRGLVRQAIMDWIKKQPQVSYVIDMENMAAVPVPQPIHDMVVNGYHPTRSGSIQVIFNPGWYDYGGRYTGTTHGTWNPYDTHIPLLWYGWQIKPGVTNSPVNMTDIAPTIAALLHIQMPSGCVGKPIKGIVD